MATQQTLKLRMWGSKRKGAGRPRKDGVVGARPGVEPVTRPLLAERFPVHVTWRMDKRVWNLRTRRCFAVMQRAMYAGALKSGFRLVRYAVIGNHVHLLVEAPNRVRLFRGMQGLGIRLARALNGVMKRRGRVIGDRYHARLFADNARHHYADVYADAFASHIAVAAPWTWLLRRAAS
ncbi:MAG: transposase [Myxococcales bacterium]|nr:transposase [Myxococcales bacterium]